MVVLQPITLHEMRRVESDLPQHVFASHSLVAQVVQRVTGARMRHAQMRIHLVEEDWHQPCLPVMTMDDVRVLVRLEHELERCPAEESKSFNVIVLTVNSA